MVIIRFLTGVKMKVGKSEVEIKVKTDEQYTVAQFMEEYYFKEFPQDREMVMSDGRFDEEISIVLNKVISGWDAVITNGDELVLLTPITGG